LFIKSNGNLFRVTFLQNYDDISIIKTKLRFFFTIYRFAYISFFLFDIQVYTNQNMGILGVSLWKMKRPFIE